MSIILDLKKQEPIKQIIKSSEKSNSNFIKGIKNYIIKINDKINVVKEKVEKIEIDVKTKSEPKSKTNVNTKLYVMISIILLLLIIILIIIVIKKVKQKSNSDLNQR